MPAEDKEKRQAAREVIDILHEIATLLVRLSDLILSVAATDLHDVEHEPQPSATIVLRIAHREWCQSGSSRGKLCVSPMQRSFVAGVSGGFMITWADSHLERDQGATRTVSRASGHRWSGRQSVKFSSRL